MTEKLQNWVKENKLVVSESKLDGSDIISIEGVGDFLYIKPTDNKIIDGDFSFILSNEEFDILDENKVKYILFEFGGKFYYSNVKQNKNKYNEIIYKPEFNDFKYLGPCAEEHLMNFVNLGVHDEYEMLSGSGACDLWCKKAKFLGHTAIGVCDMNSLASSLSFQTYAEKMGLKCVIGETIKVAVNYDPREQIQETFDLKLYVVNDLGWKNLLMISKAVNVDYDKFIPEEELLLKYTKGLCCVIPRDSHFNYLLGKGKREEAKKALAPYLKAFKRIYYQVDTVEYVSQTLFRQHLNTLDKYIMYFKDSIQPILINDSYYLDKEEWELKGYLSKISGKASNEANNQYFKSVQDTLDAYGEWINDVEPLFETIIEGIQNTVVLTDKINFRINNADRKIPEFEVEDPEGLFFEQLQKGIEERLVGKVDDLDKYLKRIETECELIVPNDLCSYFLILWDIINWCRENDIMTGPGRGSVAGSLVAYCLYITDVDPLVYGLYFERFLNPTRVEKHHNLEVILENGKKVLFKEGEKIPLISGEDTVYIYGMKVEDLDIDINRL